MTLKEAKTRYEYLNQNWSFQENTSLRNEMLAELEELEEEFEELKNLMKW